MIDAYMDVRVTGSHVCECHHRWVYRLSAGLSIVFIILPVAGNFVGGTAVLSLPTLLPLH